MTREEFITNVKESQRQLRLFLLGLCGDGQLADDLAERRRLAETFLRHYAPADAPVDLPPDAALAATQFLVFTAEAVSGKQNLP